MARKYMHEIPHARSINPRDFVPKTKAQLAERRQARERLRDVLDGHHGQLAFKLQSTRSPARAVVSNLLLNPWPFEPWEVATIIRLWAWENFKGQLALEQYDHGHKRIIFYW